MTERHCNHTAEPGEPLHCDRCNVKVEGMDLAGVLVVNIDSPIMRTPSPAMMLCTNCGEALANFLIPDLKDDPTYQFIKSLEKAAKAKES